MLFRLSVVVLIKRVIFEKNNILLVGPVNSGKSSVFNRLLGFERAIVSDIPGTTET